MPRRTSLIATLVAATLALTACGSQPNSTPTQTATATEMLYAIGAGKQVVAVDDQSNYPAGMLAGIRAAVSVGR